MASLLAAGMQTATWLSLPGWREARTRATNHEATHAETEVWSLRTAVAACARPVWSRSTSQIAAKAPCGRPRPHMYWLVQPVCRKSASLNRHKTWPGCKSDHVKEALAGLKALCRRMRCYSACLGMYLELRPRPMNRGHVRPHPRPAAAGTEEGGTKEPAPVPAGVTGHRTQQPRDQVGPPGPHPAQTHRPQLPPGSKGCPAPRL
jgi:hypothetical protein